MDPLYEIIDNKVIWEVSIRKYGFWREWLITNRFKEFVPTHSGSTLEGDLVTMIYEGYKILSISDHQAHVSSFIKSIPDLRYIKLSPYATEIMERDDRLYLAPWTILFCNFDQNYLNAVEEGFYWTSMNSSKAFSAVKQLTLMTYLVNKTIEIDERTNLVKLAELSEYSKERVKKYQPLEYVFQEGDSQIWLADQYVIKMVTHDKIHNHEVKMMEMGVPNTPQLIDHWSVTADQEYFVVMKNVGRSLRSLYHCESLLPDTVLEKIAQLKDLLKKNGIIASEPHLGNIVVDGNDNYTMIDMEQVKLN